MYPESDKIKQDKFHIGWQNKEYLRERQIIVEDERVERYGSFLDDGDFEKWQPCCYSDGGYTTDEWNKLRDEANKLEPDILLCPSDPEYKRQYCRIMWIRARFLPWMSNEWRLHNDSWIPTLFEISDYLNSDWWIRKEKEHHWSVGPTMDTKPSEAIDLRMERYGLFLNDGDFEKWQPCCYKYNEELKQESDNLIPTVNPGSIEYDRQVWRIHWIKGRFLTWFSDEWQLWNTKIHEIYTSHTIEEWASNTWWKEL